MRRYQPMRAAMLVAVAATAITFAPSTAEEYGGVEFPAGAVSFADTVVSYEPVIVANEPAPAYRFSDRALGVPDFPCDPTSDCVVSLGDGGSLTLQFVDNAVSGSGTPDPDLWIFEIGRDAEAVDVAVSADGIEFTTAGKAAGSAGVDLDAFGFDADSRITHVRLTDDPEQGAQTGPTLGADIDAVGAIRSQPNIATAMTATPVLVEVDAAASPPVTAYVQSISATLKLGTGETIADATVVFTAGTTELCSVPTTAEGVASCPLPTDALPTVVTSLGYVASYAGTLTLKPATADGPLLRVNGTDVP